MNNETQTNAYMIEGRHFQSAELAYAFGVRLAIEQRRHVPMLEKVPGLSWHLLRHVGHGHLEDVEINA